jgi:glycosyltransferase involved in cell wall biosynthesis
MKLPACSVVIPCLNEARSIAGVIELLYAVRNHFEDLEIVIVDNGSSDATVEFAQILGAKVIHCPIRGYGAALRFGIKEATYPFIAIADGDSTYDLSEVVGLFSMLVNEHADLVIGNRLAGCIAPNAMPFLNRYIGTPFLNRLLTLLFGKKVGATVGDCNSGMRAFRKGQFLSWEIESNGMEFASEMIARALLSHARYRELPISYRASPPGRRPHLRRWIDGVRHIRVIYRTNRTLRVSY